MTETRRATAADAEIIAEQRRLMFVDAGQGDRDLTRMVTRFVPWVRAKLEDDTYAGWLIDAGGDAIAGAGMWVMEFPPHFLDEEPRRAYLLNFYVAPHMRGCGLARQLLALAVAEAKARGIRVVTLHASNLGRPIYQRNGFVPSNEMMLRPYDLPA